MKRVRFLAVCLWVVVSGFSILAGDLANTPNTINNSSTAVTDCPGTNVVRVGSEEALRDAITQGGTVTFCYNGTITLSNTISITQDVTLDASGRQVLISGNQQVRLFSVAPGVRFTAINLTLADGWIVGPQMETTSTHPPEPPGLTVRGGAIYNDGGFVRLVGCTLTNNLARGGDGIPLSIPTGNGEGGAIYNGNNGSVALENTTVIHNQALSGTSGGSYSSPNGAGFGGALYSTGGTVQFRNIFFSSNYCSGPAGALFAKGGACYLSNTTCAIENSTFVRNAVRGNDAIPFAVQPAGPVGARGGALFLDGGTTVLNHVRFFTNSALGGNGFRVSGTGPGEGGAIYCAGELWLHSCHLRGNLASAGHLSSVANEGQGGGLYNALRTVAIGCTWDENMVQGGNATVGGLASDTPGGSALGGAVCNSGTLELTNCTLTLNIALGGSQGCYTPCTSRSGHAFGGGIFNDTNGTVSLHHVTLATNRALIGLYSGTSHAELALGANLANSNGVVFVRSSILAGDGSIGNGYGPLTDMGYNISSDGSCAFNSGTSLNFTDPLLYPLANYGGSTPTLALKATSPAIDIVPVDGAPTTDQRGVARPSGAAADAGACEGGAATPKLGIQGNGPAIQVRFSAIANTPYLLQSSSNLVHWTTEETITPSTNEGAISRSCNPVGNGHRFFRLIQE